MFWKTAFIGYNVPMPAFKNTSWIKVLLVAISTTIAQTGTVKISLQAYVNNLQQYSTYKPDFHECRVFKNYDRESV